ncbi:arylamine N-acetyltransferase family protein [Iamia sp.]|uniref:arylamine N-acetyltransferase family protein n=1 Tax=Iamia sp. TaxID=2722710 RepID=UPI002C674FBA|nr:arylamine N-acetyltransferase [Iamia sp.]HXH56259.1 arylamine N-acetyltransferase [Iamia sp.]
MARIAAPERDAYLARLGLEAEPPSVAALFRIHRAHVERVPYETLWIHLGERWGVGVGESVARIASQRRGGYCFHLNGALGELLRALGYDVRTHVGGVHGPGGATDAEMTNHLVLTVWGMPTDANPDGTWYVDAGLGDALHEPLPLLAGPYDQGPFHLLLHETPGEVGDWHLTHDPAGGFAGMAWRSAPAETDAFAAQHAWLSTSPESGFVKVLTVQRRDATGVDILRGLTLARVGDGAAESTLATRDELTDVLGDLFGLDLGPVDRNGRQTLWAKVHAAHEAWEAAGRP